MSAASRVGFSWHRWWAMVKKEFLQLRRDRITFAMIIGIPIVQLTLFGYAINTDPKHLPTGVIAADHSEFTRSFIAALTTSDYFRIVGELPDEEAGRTALAEGKPQLRRDDPAGIHARACCAASGPRSSSRPTPPTRRPRAPRSPRSCSSRARSRART